MRYAITGGTGFLGRALVRRLVSTPGVERVRVVSRDEHKKGMMTALFGRYHAFQALLADVREPERLLQVFNDVDVVIHCAALKRVDSDDNSGDESIEMLKTNCFGTLNVVVAATACKVGRVVFISSDKAVASENSYGKSKALAEEIAIAYNSISYPKGTRIAAVRYGNVLWSTGSVLCKWKEAKERGEALKLTDPAMTRFLLTVDQAVDHVLYALGAMSAGEIFIPRLPSATLGDLAQAFAPDWPVEVVGRRPGGEKNDESLIGPEEMFRTVNQGNVFVVTPSRRSWSQIPYHGDPVKPDWRYTSGANDWTLTLDELKKLL